MWQTRRSARALVCVLASGWASGFGVGCGGAGDGAPPAGPPLPPLVEDRGVYAQDAAVPVLTVKLTVADLAGLAAVDDNVPGAEVPVVFEEGGYVSNGRLELRGATTRLAAQKSYKVHLAKDQPLWRGYREVNLNKHPFDLTRVRNKLSFDILRTAPDLTSLRTQFAHVTLNGRDLGLFTAVEEMDRRFLESHGLDPAGTLYKAKSFSFQQISPDVVRDPATLQSFIEAKANPNPDKLTAMLADVHNFRLDINTVIERRFNRANYITWLAVNILIGQWDAVGQNYYLYSPSGYEGFYFLPWDYDGAWGFYEQPGQPGRRRWRAGLSNWWGSDLHRRFLENQDNVRELEATMAALAAAAVSDGAAAALLAAYRDIVRAFVARPPDIDGLPAHAAATSADALAQWHSEYERIEGSVARYQDEYRQVAERPMPIALHGFFPGDSSLRFEWGKSYDPQGDRLTYDLQISRTTGFEPENVLTQQEGLRGTAALISRPPPGAYYWRVIVRDGKNPADHWQVPFVLHEPFQIATMGAGR